MKLAERVYWHWFILGVALMIAEALLPGSFLLWFGVSAIITGAALWAVPSLAWELPLSLFAVIAIVDIVLWRRINAQRPDRSSHPSLNQRGQQYSGRRFTLSEAIINGSGRLTVDDTMWRIEGPDLPIGAQVVVNQVDGAVFRVEQVI